MQGGCLSCAAKPDDEKFAGVADYVLYARTLSTATEDDLLLEYMESNIEGGLESQKPVLESHKRRVSDALRVADKYPHLREFA